MIASIAKGWVPSLAVAMVVVATAGPVVAQSNARKNAEKVLRQGVTAQGKRDHKSAVSLLSRAVNSGALAREQLAIALYRRAISYRAQKQPARAISDLNSALFFKDDLPVKERADAIELRLKSYRDAGLKAPALATATPRAASSASIQAPGGPVQSGPRIVNAVPPRAKAPIRRVEPRQSLSSLAPTTPILGPSQMTAAPVAPPPSSSSPSIPTFSTQTKSGVVPFQATTTRTMIPTSVASVRSRPSNVPNTTWSTATRSAAPGASSVAAQPGSTGSFSAAAKPAPQFTPPRTTAPTAWRSPSVAPSAGEGPTQLGSTGLTGAKPAEAPKPTAAARARTDTTSGSASAAPVAGGAAVGAGMGEFFSSLFGQSQASSGSAAQTRRSVAGVGSADTKPEAMERVAAVSLPATSTPPAEPLKMRAKGFDIEIAALHDRYRAEAVAKQIMVQYSSDFFWNQRRTRVEKRPGPEGTILYAVRLGLYDEESVARSFCKKLEAGGFDCELVVRR